MSLSAVPFSTQSIEPLVPLMVNQYGWTPRVCRDRITVLRQTVLKGRCEGLTQPGKEWLVTEYAWKNIQGYLDGFDDQVWLSFRAYLAEQFDVDRPVDLADVLEELRSGREMDAQVQAQVLDANGELRTTMSDLNRRLSVVEELFRVMPGAFGGAIGGALDERRGDGHERGESIRDVVEDVREGLRLVAQTLSSS